MRDTIQFRLGQQDRILHEVDPTMTVLEYLRGPERLCGTKEGCAEGDCGACTVVLVDQQGRYQAVNACILFMPALDGRQLLTVELLQDADGSLHPVQQAMVDHHGSQCGFCTPGFVMSLYALRIEAQGAAAQPDRIAINEALAGNLCRCTGYRPIVDAAIDACVSAGSQIAPVLPVPEGTLALTGAGKRSFSPRSADELAQTLLAHPDAVIVAGGTDVGLWVTKQHKILPVTVSLDAVADLRTIEETTEMIRIGAGATYQEALPVLQRHFPDLGTMIRRIGSRQVRNRGTIGGNIANASPIGDMPPALLALDAAVVLRRGNARRTVGLADFFTGYRRTVLRPGEFIAAIEVPIPRPNVVFRCYKVSKRFDQDISAVCAAFRLTLQDGIVHEIRTGFGGMAATPTRTRAVEQTLTGRPWTEATIRAAQAVMDTELTPLSDMRASAAYRRAVARNLLWKCFLETSEETAVTRMVPA